MLLLCVGHAASCDSAENYRYSTDKAEPTLGKTIIGAALPIIDMVHWRACAVRQPGDAWCWGFADQPAASPARIESPKALRSLTVSSSAETCSCDLAGTVRCWGYRGHVGAQPGDPLDPYSPRVPLCRTVAGGDGRVCSLSVAGEVHCWGIGETRSRMARVRGIPVVGQRNGEPPSRTPPWFEEAVHIGDFEDIVALDVRAHACAVDGEGRVFCWGNDASGQLSSGPLEGTVVRVPLPAPAADVAVGHDHSCALGREGRVWCWGRSQFTPCPLFVAAQRRRQECTDARPREIGRFPGARSIAAGAQRACVVTAAGDLVCWGRPFGDLISHVMRDRSGGGFAPGVAPAVQARDVAAVALDLDDGCLVSTSGEVRCWGRIVGQHTLGESDPYPPEEPPSPDLFEPPGVVIRLPPQQRGP